MEKIKVKNLAHLKRLMQLGTEYCTPIHYNHPKYNGLVVIILRSESILKKYFRLWEHVLSLCLNISIILIPMLKVRICW